MNSTEFLQQLEGLEKADWQALGSGQALLLIDDSYLTSGPANAPNVIIPPPTAPKQDPATLRAQTLNQATQLLEDYYRIHPLTAIGFKTQVEDLIRHLGVAAFTALPGRLPDYSLFVEAGSVVAESRQSPRHPYGVYCELTRPLTDTAMAQFFKLWLDSGEAYERYLSMNVCRYNC